METAAEAEGAVPAYRHGVTAVETAVETGQILSIGTDVPVHGVTAVETAVETSCRGRT